MDDYLEKYCSQEPEILARLREETYRVTEQPHMISGKQQGRFLAIISKLLSPKNILEIGTFTGYATLCLAEGLAENGKITTLDINEELSYLPKKYFAESDFAEKINFCLQDGREFLQNTDEMYDLVFIDGNKAAYVDYLNLIKSRLRSGGVVLFDNVLWYGKVLEENPKSKMTKKIKELNEIVSKDDDFENLILPLRDGINLIRKK
ncbi:MAG: O-methyltransferase [Riemerella sp.]|nr:MAG: O-methyltransferase [Riemerella sp.]